MNKKDFFIILFLIINISITYAAFEIQDWSARATAMGEAFVAISDDGSAPHYNPAGIAQIEKYEIQGMYSKLFAGLDIENTGLYFTSVSVPMKKTGTINLSWAAFSVKSLYQENTFILNYANKLNQFFPNSNDIFMENTFIGINLKYLGHSYYVSSLVEDPVFKNGTSKYSFGLDIGIISKFFVKESQKYFQAGLAIFNIIQPDVGLNTSDTVPVIIKCGSVYPLKEYKFFQSIGIESPLISVAVTYKEEDFNFHIGWENKFFKNILALRLGTSLQSFNTGLGVNFVIKNVMSFELDYAFSFPYYVIKSVGNHRASFICRF